MFGTVQIISVLAEKQSKEAAVFHACSAKKTLLHVVRVGFLLSCVSGMT